MEGVRRRIEALWTAIREKKACIVVKGVTRWVVKVSDHVSGWRVAMEAVGGGEAGRIMRETRRSWCMYGGFGWVK